MFLHSKPLRIREHNIPLLVHGQGVFLFKSTTTEPCIFTILSDDVPCLEVEFNVKAIHSINMQTVEPYFDTNNTSGLSPLRGAYYWFSIDSQNQRLIAGVGEVRLETAIYRYQFPLLEGNKKWLESLTTIAISDAYPHLVPLRMLRDPVTLKIPLLVKDINQLTMDDIAKGDVMPSANLNAISQKLYHGIAGEQVVLDDDFPEFS